MRAAPQNMAPCVMQAHVLTARFRRCNHQTPNEAAFAAGGADCRRWSACKARGWMIPGQQSAMSEEQRKARPGRQQSRMDFVYSQLLAMAQATLQLKYGMRHEVLAEPL